MSKFGLVWPALITVISRLPSVIFAYAQMRVFLMWTLSPIHIHPYGQRYWTRGRGRGQMSGWRRGQMSSQRFGRIRNRSHRRSFRSHQKLEWEAHQTQRDQRMEERSQRIEQRGWSIERRGWSHRRGFCSSKSAVKFADSAAAAQLPNRRNVRASSISLTCSISN